MLTTLVVTSGVQSFDISKVWKLDIKKIDPDPATWETDFKNKLILVGTLGAASFMLFKNLPVTAGIMVCGFGLTNLSLYLVASAVLAMYGFAKKSVGYAGIGSFFTYYAMWGLFKL